MSKVKINVIGAGNMANLVHYPSLSKIENVEIAGICDLNEEKLKETSKKYKISNTFNDYKKMIEETAPDAVYIIMPPYHLFDIVIHCLNEKLNVFIEKPPGVTTQQTKQMANLAEKKGVLTMVGFQRRFAPLIVESKKRIEERGEVIMTQTNFFKYYLNQPPYYNGAIDILTCDAIHSVDLLREIGGEVKKVKSIVRNLFADYDNFFCALIEFSSGATGILSANWTSGKRIFSVEIHGKGIVAFINPEKEAVIYKDGKEEGEIINVEEFTGKKELFEIAGFLDENKHFIECIEKKKLPKTNFSDAVKTMELVDTIYKSVI